VPALHFALLVGAGAGGGLAGSIAGLASIITYPALLACGIGPIGANVTNTAALVFAGVGSTLGSRPELVGQARRLKRLVPLSVLGGLIGATAVLLTSSHLFGLIVPWLIFLAAGLILLPRLARTRPPRLAAPSGRVSSGCAPAAMVDAADGRAVAPIVGTISVYGGYFGAGAGVLLLAAFLASTREPLARANAAKNVLLGSANLAATAVFLLFGPVHVADALTVGIGCLFGSRLGPLVVRRVPAGPLQTVIGVAGLGLAGTLAYRAY
jgi:uncharacterized membrane protein YfcA